MPQQDHPQLEAVPIVRMSMDRQANSPERQRQLFRDYCHKYDLIASDAEYYDPGVSATHTAILDRPAIQQLLADAPAATWTVVWFEEYQRAARKGEHLVELENRLRKHGAFLVGPSDNPYALADAHFRKLMLFIGGWRGEGETLDLARRVRDTQAAYARDGRYRGGARPPGLGWEWDDRKAKVGHYVLDEATQPLAVRAFELYVETRCYQQVALRLEAEGYRTRHGKQFSMPSARELLLNPVYRGAMRWGGDVYPTPGLPQIVPEDLVARVDGLLAQRRQRSQRSTHLQQRAIFAGLLACPVCGHWLRASFSRPRPTGGTYVSYGCDRSRRVPVTCSWRRMVPQLSLERAILPEIVWQSRELLGSAPEPQDERPQRRQQQTRRRLEAERARVLKSYHKGWITEADCEQQVAELDARLRDATTAPAAPPQPQVSADELEEFRRQLLEVWPVLSPGDKRSLLQSMVARIVPNPDDLSDSRIDFLGTTTE